MLSPLKLALTLIVQYCVLGIYLGTINTRMNKLVTFFQEIKLKESRRNIEFCITYSARISLPVVCFGSEMEDWSRDLTLAVLNVQSNQ